MSNKVSKGQQDLQAGLNDLQAETPMQDGLNALFGIGEQLDQSRNQQENHPEFADDITQAAALRRERLKNVGRPRKGDDSKRHNKDRQMRVTTIISCSTIEKIRAISYTHTIQIKDVIEAFLIKGIEDYERKNGTIDTARPQGQIADLM